MVAMCSVCQNAKSKSFFNEKLTRCCHNTMSDKGEALASELAALSVEEASAPPDSAGARHPPSQRRARTRGEDHVRPWLRRTQGVSARARGLSRVRNLGGDARARAARRDARARARGAIAMPRCFGVDPPTVRRARSRGRRQIRPRASRFPARHTAPDKLGGASACSALARLMPLPIAGFVTRDDGEGASSSTRATSTARGPAACGIRSPWSSASSPSATGGSKP